MNEDEEEALLADAATRDGEQVQKHAEPDGQVSKPVKPPVQLVTSATQTEPPVEPVSSSPSVVNSTPSHSQQDHQEHRVTEAFVKNIDGDLVIRSDIVFEHLAPGYTLNGGAQFETGSSGSSRCLQTRAEITKWAEQQCRMVTATACVECGGKDHVLSACPVYQPVNADSSLRCAMCGVTGDKTEFCRMVKHAADCAALAWQYGPRLATLFDDEQLQQRDVPVIAAANNYYPVRDTLRCESKTLTANNNLLRATLFERLIQVLEFYDSESQSISIQHGSNQSRERVRKQLVGLNIIHQLLNGNCVMQLSRLQPFLESAATQCLLSEAGFGKMVKACRTGKRIIIKPSTDEFESFDAHALPTYNIVFKQEMKRLEHVIKIEAHPIWTAMSFWRWAAQQPYSIGDLEPVQIRHRYDALTRVIAPHGREFRVDLLACLFEHADVYHVLPTEDGTVLRNTIKKPNGSLLKFKVKTWPKHILTDSDRNEHHFINVPNDIQPVFAGCAWPLKTLTDGGYVIAEDANNMKKVASRWKGKLLDAQRKLLNGDDTAINDLRTWGENFKKEVADEHGFYISPADAFDYKIEPAKKNDDDDFETD